jgi:hypothetical protein
MVVKGGVAAGEQLRCGYWCVWGTIIVPTGR